MEDHSCPFAALGAYWFVSCFFSLEYDMSSEYMQKEDEEKDSCSFVAWGGCLPAQTHVRLCHPNRLCAFSNSSSSHVGAYAHSLVHPVLCSHVTWARDFWCTKCTQGGGGVTDLGLS